MKLTFGIKNILRFTLGLVSSLFWGYMIYVTIYESPEIESFSELASTVFFLSLWLCFSLWYTLIQVVPKYFKVMRAVRKYITFSELRELVKDEVFEHLELPPSINNCLSKSDKKEYKKSLLVSKNWVYADNIMIPKKMIVLVDMRNSHYRDLFSLKLANKSKFEFVGFRLDDDKQATKLVNYFSRNFIIHDVSDTTLHIENFKCTVLTREDFLRYIK